MAGVESDPKSSRSPSPIDVHVGARIRLRRMLLGMSQETLGDKLGLTFQQVQKYEKGINRIGASRLFNLANVLGVPVQFFFKEMSLGGDRDRALNEEDVDEGAIMTFLRTRDGLELSKAFLHISDTRVRRAVLDLVRSLGAHDASCLGDTGGDFATKAPR